MLSIKSWDSFVTGSACVLFLAQCFAQSASVFGGQRAGAAQLAGPVPWGSPDQAYGKRRPVTAADRAAIQNYRSGHKTPIFSTDFSDRAELHADWNLVSDDNQWGDYQSCRRPGNVEASSVGLRLKTLLATDCHHKWSTGYINSKAKHGPYGFFEATMKIADIKGMNNAFWMTTEDHPETGDHFEIDVSEVQFPNYDHIGLQQYPARWNKNVKHTGMGWGAALVDDLSSDFHDYGVLWTPMEMIFEIDGEPVAAVLTNNAVKGPTDIAFSSALIYAGIPAHPEGHDVNVESVRVFEYQK
jgi:beta-glucanase (GH16 family)